MYPGLVCYETMTSARSRTADLFRSHSHPMRALHDRHVAITAKLDILDTSVVQPKIEAGKDRRDREV